MAAARVGLPVDFATGLAFNFSLDFAFLTGAIFCFGVAWLIGLLAAGGAGTLTELPVGASNCRSSRNCCATWRDFPAATSYCLARASSSEMV